MVPVFSGLVNIMQVNASGFEVQTDGLNGAVVALGQLANLLRAAKQDPITLLTKLATDTRLKTLGTLVDENNAEFDALDLMGVANRELTHSKVLAWLLDPRESHGTGDHFLKRFLLDVVGQAQGIGASTFSPENVIATDWSKTHVRTEWPIWVDDDPGLVDILVLNSSALFLCVVENKIHAGEHGRQLTRYRNALRAEFPGLSRHHVLLTPHGALASEHKEQQKWIPFAYANVLENVQRTIDNACQTKNADALAFLRQYATTLRRNVVPETASHLQELAREIYLEHREAIDLIIANRPDFEAEIKDMIRRAVEQRENWRLDIAASQNVGFYASEWHHIGAFQKGIHGGTNSLLLFETVCQYGNMRLKLVMRPSSDPQIREKIHSSVLKHADVFSGTRKKYTQMWTQLDNRVIITGASTFDVWNDPDTPDAIASWVANLAENQFPAMNEVIVNCLREYEAEAQG